MSQKLIAKLNKVIVKQYPELEDLEVTPSLEQQKFKSDKYGYNEVTVNAIECEALNIKPSSEEQVKEGLFNRVTVEGESNLVSENIKKDVSIFGVVGSHEGGDNINIFMQETEPEIKEGIWLQKEGAFDLIVPEEEVFVAGEWNGTERYSAPPASVAFTYHIGDKIYMTSLGTTYKLYEYDIKNNTYKAYDFNYSEYTSEVMKPFGGLYSTNIGSALYFFVRPADGTCFKYDVTTHEFSSLGSMLSHSYTEYAYNGSCFAKGTDIYIVGGYSNSKYLIMKYDTLTDTYTMLSNNMGIFYKTACCVIGNYLYLFGSDESSSRYKSAWRYDLTTQKVASIASAPVEIRSCSLGVIGSDIYIFKGTTALKYDTLTNIYTTLTAPSTLATNGNQAIVVDDKRIFIFSGKVVNCLNAKGNSYDKNAIVIYPSRYDIAKYKTQLFSAPDNVQGRMLYSFNNAWYYDVETDGLDDTIPTYYGNGTEWIKFKN